MAEIVEIPLSTDRFESEIIYESVRSHGYDVELMHDESSGGIGLWPSPTRLFVHQSDVEAVQQIINESHPTVDDRTIVQRSAGATPVLSPQVRRVVQVVLVVVIALWVYQMVSVFIL